MAQQCRTCAHAELREVHRCRDQGATLQELQDAFGIHRSALDRHFHSSRCAARFEALACAPEAALGRPVPVNGPPMRRRAITSGGRPSVNPGSHPQADLGVSAVVLAPAYSIPMATAPVQAKSSLPTSPQELALLGALGYNAQELAELMGGEAGSMTEFIENNRGTKRAIGEITRPEWARQCIRLRVDFLFSLRRQQQAAIDCGRFREVRAYNGDIDRAMSQLLKTLEVFGFAGPVDPSEISKEGDDVREMLGAILEVAQTKGLPLNDDERSGFLEQERQYAEGNRAIA